MAHVHLDVCNREICMTGVGLNPTVKIEGQQGCDVKFGCVKGAIISMIPSIGEQSFN